MNDSVDCFVVCVELRRWAERRPFSYCPVHCSEFVAERLYVPMWAGLPAIPMVDPLNDVRDALQDRVDTTTSNDSELPSIHHGRPSTSLSANASLM